MNKLLLQLKQKCVANPVLTIFMSMIVGINFIFHRPIQIINAVSLKIENDYSIHLSVFRELLEPIVGIPLFYLRAGEPVEEYIVLWIWIFLSFGLYLFLKKGFSFYKKADFQSHKSNKKTSLKAQNLHERLQVYV